MNDLMKKMLGMAGALALAASVVLIGGCNTVEGAGEDVEAAGEGVQDASRDIRD